MNQGRIWTVVSPTVGLPLLLGSVTGIALLVHAAVLTNTTWYPAYWQGAKKSAELSVPAKTADASFSTTYKRSE
jgi:light-harvesting protein B-800-850 alpha chain